MPAAGNVHPEGAAGVASVAAVPARGHAWFALLVALVTLAHLWLADSADVDRFGLGATADARPARMQVAFVRELAQKAPPALARTAAPRPVPRKAPVPSAAASQPEGTAEEPLPERGLAPPPDRPASAAPSAPVEDPALSVAAAAAQAMASAPAAASASAPQPVPTAEVAVGSVVAASGAASSDVPASTGENAAWPPSTRLSYTLTGNYRGPVEGQAQVEWLLEGARYQVHMDLSIGPAFAPLASRRVSSEGLVTPQGLVPHRYDEVTRAMLRQPQAMTVWLDEDRVRLSNGRVETRPPGVQDSASQFVQLTWLFTTQPELLRAGQSVTLPLALPRNLERWVYDVLGAQTLSTPAGDVETYHVKPRRPPRAGNDLTAEIWVAPSLQYLPVRIVIRQDAETFLDLLISRLPQQAAVRR